MPEATASTSTIDAPATIESPPRSPQPVNAPVDDDARNRLHRLAMQLIRTQNRRLLVEFLTLRRAMR
jgi:hypothetical protein